MDLSTIGGRIESIRKENNLSRKEFAKQLGCPEGEIVNVEYNRLKKPEQKESLYRSIATEFGVSLEWIKEGGERTPPPKRDPVVEGFIQFLNGRTPEQKELIAQQLRELVACIDQAEQRKERQEKPLTLPKVAARGAVDQDALAEANTDIPLPDMESDIIP